MILLADIGNTHVHLGLATPDHVLVALNAPTTAFLRGEGRETLKSFVAGRRIRGASVASVVPHATGPLATAIRREFGVEPFQLTPRTLKGVGLKYPRPDTIGQDRLANALAARQLVGAPVVVVDFGTAVTFDVVDPKGRYVGGVIAPGISAMTEYLHEKTALLPRIKITEPRRAVGRSTREAMLSGAVYGYRGLVREILAEVRKELASPAARVIATGGYAQLIARGLPLIEKVWPQLTLEGLRLAWRFHQASLHAPADDEAHQA
jgi:type III pantothenate kinase